MASSLMTRLLTAGLAALVLAAVGGCGYRAARIGGEGSALADKTVHVDIFTNKSYRPNVEAVLTNSLIDEFVRREGSRAVEAGGDLTLSGAVVSYGTAAVSYTATDTVKEYRATVTVEATLRRSDSRQVLWKGSLSAYQDFPANDDLVLQQNSEEQAIAVICRRLARELTLRMSENF